MFWNRKPVPGLEDTLRTLSKRLDDAESAVRMLKTEWLDTLDRIERIAGRLAKRAVRDQAPPPPERANGTQSPEVMDHDPVMIRRSGKAFPGTR